MKGKTIAAAMAVGAMAVPAGAMAHVGIHPNTLPAGAFATLNVRVPGEREGTEVGRVDMLFPPGFAGVSYENVPGWTVRVLERRLTSPIQSEDGPIDSEVARVVWTWKGPLGRVGDGQFVDLPLAVAIPDDDTGRALRFKTVQTYGDGEVERWIDESPTAEHPAPSVNVTAKGGAIQDVAGAEAGPAPGESPTADSGAGASTPAVRAQGGASEGLALAALLVGALGLLVGGSALVAVRGRRGSARR